ncbi:leucine-rich repeat-containing protein 27-like isoform X1 [Polyodon spathula]|uniref:leucine-rich repeat-containing protein 27-like isoform X1 n=1 Tax=Polyodon spathula TaxID=7913 RepID=UPI001B7DD312|nr:leucine-rich repeat-containing protein 27-like isoform X1 [Polyodon spathula]
MDEDRLLMVSLKEEESYEDQDVSLDRGDNTEKAIEHYTSEKIKRSLEDIEHNAAATLDLSRKSLQHVDDLFNISRIENLYLEGNEISSLPDHFFSELSNLVWLDLRNNQINCLPPGIGQHRCLKTLLLEGNPIKELPIELGNLITLSALSLRQCPIEFPPENIVHQGLQAILKFLRSAMTGKPIYTRNSFQEMPPIEKLRLTDLVKSSLELSEEWPNDEEMKRFEKLRKEMMQADEADMGDTDQAFQLVPSIDRAVLKCKGPRKTIIASLPKRKQVPLKYTFPELPHYDNQSRTTAQERRLLALKDLKEKQALIEQRRNFRMQGCIVTKNTVNCLQSQKQRDLYVVATQKSNKEGDQELLKEWREHSKCMQEKGEMESRQGGMALVKSDEVLKNAPYAVDPDFYRMLDSRECIKPGSREEQKLLTRKSLKDIEEARAARDRELEHRIRTHIQMMQERRRKSKGTVQEEIDATRTEMETAQKLQSEVVQRKLERDVPLEYRFTAFTGEQSS